MPRDGTIVGLVGLLCSAALIVAGTIRRLRFAPGTKTRMPLVWVGLSALMGFAAWLLLGVYIDTVTR
ncbi:MAG TPA: hypothetical protein VD695_00775 [Gaiellaceae bacterium]|nr:hypothetical protein [Gaiellaceae bacterium]